MKAKKMINLHGTALEGTRIDQANTPTWWAKVRNIAGTVFFVSGVITTTIATGGLAAPAWVLTGLGTITTVSGIISGRAAMAKQKK